MHLQLYAFFKIWLYWLSLPWSSQLLFFLGNADALSIYLLDMCHVLFACIYFSKCKNAKTHTAPWHDFSYSSVSPTALNIMSYTLIRHFIKWRWVSIFIIFLNLSTSSFIFLCRNTDLFLFCFIFSLPFFFLLTFPLPFSKLFPVLFDLLRPQDQNDPTYNIPHVALHEFIEQH